MSAFRLTRAGAVQGGHGLGFLDIMASVLGIFIVVFAVRVVLMAQTGGVVADRLIAVADEGAVGRVTLIDPRGERIVTGDREAVVEGVAAALRTAAQAGTRPLTVRILVPADGFRTQLWVEHALRDLRQGQGDDFAPVLDRLEPVATPAALAARIAAWRALAASAAPNDPR